MIDERLTMFVTAAGKVRDVAVLKKYLLKELVRRGFERFAYVAVRKPGGEAGRLYLGTYPPDWALHYSDRDLWLHDPVMRFPFRAVQPFLWDDVLRSLGDRTVERLVFGPASDAGLRAGGAVPIHGPFGGVALLAVSNDCPEQAFHALFAEQRFALQVIAYAAHDAVIRLTTTPAGSGSVNLSPRQKEVLLWTVNGKTNWEIGEILRISEDTVRQHLRAICRSLGAINRAQAAAIAVNRGLIAPDAGQRRTTYLT